jgi:hypothetical protein
MRSGCLVDVIRQAGNPALPRPSLPKFENRLLHLDVGI